jgi:hypothetical protein
MKLTYLQKPLIKPSVYVLLVSILFASVFTQLDRMLTEMNQEVQSEQSRVESLYQEVHTTLDKIELVKRYSQHFKSLSADGVIGVQSRGEWIDKFMEVINRNQVLHAKLQFSPRSLLESSQLSIPIDAQLARYETINFEAAFQHEVDVLNFMDDVKKQVHELVLVQGCTLSLTTAGNDSIGKGFQFRAQEGNILAKCQFYFLEVSRSNEAPASQL